MLADEGTASTPSDARHLMIFSTCGRQPPQHGRRSNARYTAAGVRRSASGAHRSWSTTLWMSRSVIRLHEQTIMRAFPLSTLLGGDQCDVEVSTWTAISTTDPLDNTRFDRRSVAASLSALETTSEIMEQPTRA